MPAGVHYPQVVEVEVKRQRLEPGDYFVVQLGVLTDLVEEGRMLIPILFGVRSQAPAGALRVRCLERNGVELVIAHEGKRGDALDHRAHQAIGLDLLRAAVNKIADENGLPVGVAPALSVRLVAHPLKQLLQPTRVSMDVTDDIVHDLLTGPLSYRHTMPSPLTRPARGFRSSFSNYCLDPN